MSFFDVFWYFSFRFSPVFQPRFYHQNAPKWLPKWSQKAPKNQPQIREGFLEEKVKCFLICWCPLTLKNGVFVWEGYQKSHVHQFLTFHQISSKKNSLSFEIFALFKKKIFFLTGAEQKEIKIREIFLVFFCLTP